MRERTFEMELSFPCLGWEVLLQLQNASITDVTHKHTGTFKLVTKAVDSRAELMLAEVAIHVLVQLEEDVAQPLSIALAEPALLGLFQISLYPELHQLIPHAAHHNVPDLHPASHQTKVRSCCLESSPCIPSNQSQELLLVIFTLHPLNPKSGAAAQSQEQLLGMFTLHPIRPKSGAAACDWQSWWHVVLYE